jgi:hypothetical protein
MKKVIRIKESELVTLIDKIITETTRKQKITEGVRNLTNKKVIKEIDVEQFEKDIMNKPEIKVKIKVNNETGVITLKNLKKDANTSYKYRGVLLDNGGISSIKVLKGKEVILSNFPNTSGIGYIGNTTFEKEIETKYGMANAIDFKLIEFN